MIIEKWCVANQALLYQSPNDNKLIELFNGSVVELTGQQKTVPMQGKDKNMHDTAWVEVSYRNNLGVHTGWVRDDLFDAYMEKFPNHEVDIPGNPTLPEDPFPHATDNPNDAAQYMVLGKDKQGKEIVKFNLCGELCVAFVMGVGIKQFLKDWENTPGSLFKWALGGDSDKATDASVIKNMLKTYSSITDGNIVDFAESLNESIFEGQNVTPGRFKRMLQTHYLLANVVINKFTGKLIPADDKKTDWAGHWVILDKVVPNDIDSGRVEIYNPFLNRRQEYSYDNFISSFGGGTFTGLWIKRKQDQPEDNVPASNRRWCVETENLLESPGGPKILKLDRGSVVDFTGTRDLKNGIQWSQVKYKGRTVWARDIVLENFTDRFTDVGVFIPHPTPEEDDAAQYLYLPGESGKKHNMCGQLCAAFIIGVDIESFVADWKEKATKFYELAIAGETDRGTGIDSIKSMFLVEPYNAKPGDIFNLEAGMMDPITGHLIISPGKFRKMLETFYLVAGVKIKKSDKLTGRLSGQGVGHWIVVDKVFPNGKQGGNGGWVEVYNPFPNKKQEYSYSEFINAFAGYLGLWVKRK